MLVHVVCSGPVKIAIPIGGRIESENWQRTWTRKAGGVKSDDLSCCVECIAEFCPEPDDSCQSVGYEPSAPPQ